MFKYETTQWKRISTEVAAIVCSILLAFAIDAWWDNRQESNSDTAHLTAVLNELHKQRELLEEAISAHEVTIAAGDEILAYTASKGVDEPANSVPFTLSRLLNFYQINAPFGALETAMSAGAIPRMNNNELATSLANWPVAIDDLLEEQIQGKRLMFGLLSTLSEQSPLAEVYKERLRSPTIRGTNEIIDFQAYRPEKSAFYFKPESLFDNHEVENDLLLLLILAQASRAEASSFVEQLAPLIDQLDACIRNTNC